MRWSTYQRNLERLHTSVHPSASKLCRLGSSMVLTCRCSNRRANCRFQIIRLQRPRLSFCRRHAAEIAAGLNQQPRLCRQERERGEEEREGGREGWGSDSRRSKGCGVERQQACRDVSYLTEKVFTENRSRSVVNPHCCVSCPVAALALSPSLYLSISLSVHLLMKSATICWTHFHSTSTAPGGGGQMSQAVHSHGCFAL